MSNPAFEIDPLIVDEGENEERVPRTAQPLPLPAPFPVGAVVRNKKDRRVVTIVRTFDGRRGTGEKMWNEEGPLGMNDNTVHGYSVWVNEKIQPISKVEDHLSGRFVNIGARDAGKWERIA